MTPPAADPVTIDRPFAPNAPSEPYSKAQLRILKNFDRFLGYADRAERMLAQKRLDEAAMQVVLAARACVHTHAGLFASKRLETVLHGIAAEVCADDAPFERVKQASDVRRVLHVATELVAFGGSTRMLSRWIDADPDRENSIALTSHTGSLPQHILEAVERSGGTITLLGGQVGTQIDRARKLRELAREYDLVVMHVHCEDEVPMLAFARQDTLPPVLLLNHADHLFWIGSSVAHAVLSLRNAAADICRDRRGVSDERNLLLPTLVDPVERRLDRNEVRAELGVTPDQVLLVSVAREAKYKNFGGQTFADRHVELLKKHPNAVLMVVGCGVREDWAPAREAVGGRIIPFEQRDDVYRFLEAADIYVDSYPFVSSTSQMEAARYGLPIASVLEAPKEASIVGINHLGLEGTSLVCSSWRDYWQTLSRLIEDPQHRAEAGEASRRNVESCCEPPAWRDWLERAYTQALAILPIPSPNTLPDNIDTPGLKEPDTRHESMFGSLQSLEEIEKVYMGGLPLLARLRVWRSLKDRGEIRSLAEAVRMLMPGWLKARLRPCQMRAWMRPTDGVIRRVL